MKAALCLIFVLVWIMSNNDGSSSLSPTTVTITNTKLLIRDIRACNKDVSKALTLLEDTSEEGPYLAALQVCGKAKRHDVAIDLCRQMPNSESCRALAISVCGRCGEYKQALKLLKEGKHRNRKSIQSYNAAIAACGHSHAWKEALNVLESMPLSLVNTFTCNAVLTALAKSKRGKEAFDLLKRMKSREYSNATPDRNTYDHVINALLRQQKLDRAHTVFCEMKQHPDTFPKDGTFELLITAFGKRKKWDMAHALERERLEQGTTQQDDSKDGLEMSSFNFWDMESMVKVGRGKYARWEFGTLLKNGKELAFAVHPHRNPAKNGISIFLVDNSGDNPVKLGYVIMINSASANTSTLLGVFVDPKQRKEGYSKIFLALWFKLCLHAKIQPRTGIINKPLLALVLQHTFGCIPQEGAGNDAELSPGKDEGTIVLYSSCAKDLQGAFSPKDIKREGLEFTSKPTKPRGRKVTVGTSFSPPKDEEALTRAIDKILAGKVSYKLTSHELRRVFLGEK